MTETTPADELRTAAATLRCDHRYPVHPPHGSLVQPGACSKCGAPWGGVDIPNLLCEPLDRLLSHTADDTAPNSKSNCSERTSP